MSTVHAAHHHPLALALPLFLVAGLMLTSLDTTAKYLVRDHSVFLVVWARYAGQMLVTTPIAWQRGGAGFWRTHHPRMQLLRSLCLVVATACFFGALRFLPLAEGTCVSFLAPMIALLLAYPVLGERPTRARWLAAVGGFAGILILVRPGGAVFHPAVGLLLMAALANALYQLLTRKLPRDPSHTTLFYSGLVGTIVLSAALPFVDTPDAIVLSDLFFLLILGVLAGFGHWGLIIAFTRAPATLVAPFTYVGVIWATLYGWAIFGHLPDGVSFVGMAVIVASGVGLMAHERLQRR